MDHWNRVGIRRRNLPRLPKKRTLINRKIQVRSWMKIYKRKIFHPWSRKITEVSNIRIWEQLATTILTQLRTILNPKWTQRGSIWYNSSRTSSRDLIDHTLEPEMNQWEIGAISTSHLPCSKTVLTQIMVWMEMNLLNKTHLVNLYTSKSLNNHQMSISMISTMAPKTRCFSSSLTQVSKAPTAECKYIVAIRVEVFLSAVEWVTIVSSQLILISKLQWVLWKLTHDQMKRSSLIKLMKLISRIQ